MRGEGREGRCWHGGGQGGRGQWDVMETVHIRSVAHMGRPRLIPLKRAVVFPVYFFPNDNFLSACS